MKYIKLKNTNIKVSEIAFGGWAIAGGFNWGYQDKKDSIEALRSAYENGINFFDTAELYGNGQSENLISEALNNVRDDIIIASKVATQHFARNEMIYSCEQSLKHLKTDYIDLYQLHWPCRTVPIEETIENLELLKSQGKIREYGVSNFGKTDMGKVFNITNKIRTNQLAYNLLFRAIEFEILPKCIESDIPVLCYSPLMQGLLTGKFTSPDDVPVERARTRHFSSSRKEATHNYTGAEKLTFDTINKIKKVSDRLNISMEKLALSWLLSQKGISSVIIGGRNTEQVEKNIKATKVNLSEEILEELSLISKPLKVKLGSNADLWQNISRIS